VQELTGCSSLHDLYSHYGDTIRVGKDGREQVYDHREQRWVNYSDAYRKNFKRLTGL
jgi:hypothetical protein